MARFSSLAVGLGAMDESKYQPIRILEKWPVPPHFVISPLFFSNAAQPLGFV